MLEMHSSNQKVIIGASSTYVLTFVLLFESGSKNAKICEGRQSYCLISSVDQSKEEEEEQEEGWPKLQQQDP
jgi:hypothetical protein